MTAISSALTHRPTPPPPLPYRPYKRETPPLALTAPLALIFPLSQSTSTTTTEFLLCHHFLAVARPAHYHPSPGEARNGIPVLRSSPSALAGELSLMEALLHRALAAFCSCHRRSMVDHALGHGPPPMDPVHGILFSKAIHYFNLIQRSCKKVPGLLGNQPVDPWLLKNNSREVPSLEKSTK
jgi:hypothetical protein